MNINKKRSKAVNNTIIEIKELCDELQNKFNDLSFFSLIPDLTDASAARAKSISNFIDIINQKGKLLNKLAKMTISSGVDCANHYTKIC